MMDGGIGECKWIHEWLYKQWVGRCMDKQVEFSEVQCLLSLSGTEGRGSLRKAQKLRLHEHYMAQSHAVHLERAGKQTLDMDSGFTKSRP